MGTNAGKSKDDDGYGFDMWSQVNKNRVTKAAALRDRIANRAFMRRMRGRQVPQRNPQGLNKPQNDRG